MEPWGSFCRDQKAVSAYRPTVCEFEGQTFRDLISYQELGVAICYQPPSIFFFLFVFLVWEEVLLTNSDTCWKKHHPTPTAAFQCQLNKRPTMCALLIQVSHLYQHDNR